MLLRRTLPLVVLLAGCTDSDWSGIVGASSDPPAVTDRRAMVRGGALPASDRHCQDAAKERANDTAVQGFEPEIQRSVYDKTYADCLHWSVRMTR